nr:MAG TPA: DNA-binding protein [Caudoviricetes sp.]
MTTARRSVKGQRAMTIDEIADTASYLGIPVTELLRRAVAA